MQWFKKHFITLLLVLIALAGVGLIAYPTFADWWNSFHQSRAVASYMEAVTDLDKEQYESILRSAEEYNEKLARKGFMWKLSEEEEKEYFKQLNVNDTGIMGYISIPKANVELPIYHGTDEAVLQIAIGHIEGTSLPVGGENTHCVVSGHRGLPSARLFTDIDKLVEGDHFTMSVLNKTVTYEVDQIRIVEPTDLSDLTLEKGRDYCTLVTCTPYGINSHRLLVRGHRVENEQGDALVVADALVIRPLFIAPFIGGPLLVILLVWMMLASRKRRKRNMTYERVRAELEEKKNRKGINRELQRKGLSDDEEIHE
jgi:sortase A